MLDNNGFDVWAKEYEKTVQKDSNGYPFKGYYDVLDLMYGLIEQRPKNQILDIGVGTGILTNRLYEDGAQICGIDFSKKMLQIAQNKMPEGKFIQWDFNLGLPPEFGPEKFNYIISSYAFHHLSNSKKISLIDESKALLDKTGKIIIGDVAFETEEGLLKCKKESKSKWDEDEIYIIADEMAQAIKKHGLAVNYTQVSSCAGVLEIHQLHEA
ncbi:MAG TPA: SAM-dependent methyltransferase [Clostridiaceae bacterium]|nr:SAM-dependent methyltransferase [Clostridiaceae bacterium]